MDFAHSSPFIGDPKIEYDTGNGFIKYVLIAKIVNLFAYV